VRRGPAFDCGSVHHFLAINTAMQIIPQRYLHAIIIAKQHVNEVVIQKAKKDLNPRIQRRDRTSTLDLVQLYSRCHGHMSHCADEGDKRN